jgi:hypothetical protein
MIKVFIAVAMDKKSMTVILSAAFLGVCAIGAIAYKRYWDRIQKIHLCISHFPG